MFDFWRRLLDQPAGERDTMLTVHLEQAASTGGCPLCNLTATAELRYFEGLWYENVNDPGVSNSIMASRGFCTEHTRAMLAGRPEVLSPSGVAILFGRLLRRLQNAATTDRSLLKWLHPHAPCPVCVARARTDRAYLPEYARTVGHLPGTATGPVRLCRPHLQAFAPYTDMATLTSQMRLTTTFVTHKGTSAARERLGLAVGRAPLKQLPSEPVCPACQAAAHAARAARDTSTLCRLHAWDLYDDAAYDGLTTERDAVPMAGCHACRAASAAVKPALMALENGAGLCLGHLRAALGYRLPLRDGAVTAIAALAGELKRFAESFDYRHPGTPTAGEVASWRNVLARFGGESVESSVAVSLPFTPAEPENEVR